MEIKRSELEELVKTQVIKESKKVELENKIKAIQAELSFLNEDVAMPTAPTSYAQPQVEEEEPISIFDDTKPGSIVVFNFEGLTISLQRQFDNLFKVTDSAESKKLKDGDYVKITGNDLLKKGKKIKFVILRQALNYETNPLLGWRVIKN